MKTNIHGLRTQESTKRQQDEGFTDTSLSARKKSIRRVHVFKGRPLKFSCTLFYWVTLSPDLMQSTLLHSDPLKRTNGRQ